MHSHSPLTVFRICAFLAWMGAGLPLTAGNGQSNWPASNREADGVLWFWGTGLLIGEVLDGDGQWAREGEVIFRHQARPTWFRGAAPHRGFVEAAEAGPALARAMDISPGLHLEAAVHPHPARPLEGIFFWLGTFGDETIWQLRLAGNHLWIDRPGEDSLRVASMALSEPAHVALTLTNGSAELWIDGEPAAVSAINALPAFADPWDVIAVFGGAPGAENPFNGALEYLLIGTRRHATAENARAWRSAHAARTPPKTLTVSATLTAHAREPREEELSEYGSALLGTVWTLLEAVPDGPAAGGELLIWQPYVLNSRVYPETRPAAPGSIQTLILSPVDDQPQLEGIQQLMDGLDADQLILLPEFYLLGEQTLSGD